MNGLHQTILAIALAAGSSWACSDDDPATLPKQDTPALPDADADADAVADPDADSGPTDTPVVEVVDAPDTPGDADAEAEAEVTPPLPTLPTRAPLAVPADPLADTERESCATYLEERCADGELQRCAVYDPAAEAFVAAPDALLHRVLLYDRWRDLYNSPDGQAIDRDFVSEVLPGTPEAEWSQLERFKCYCGTGDGGIWTGWATVAAILRYAQTGTEADYARMEQQVRDLVTMYDVTGIPGYLCRYHFLLMPAGAPTTDQHIQRWEDSFSANHHDRLIPNPETIPNLPAIYTEGITDAEGKVWKGTPMWHGRPSIDQNTGPMTALPMAHGLLRDEALKERITHHLTCYLKRLQRVELINLQSNQDLLDALVAYFATGELQLDPEDLDLTKLDRIVGYVQRQANTENEDTLDKGCPDTVQLEPWRVIDAADDSFLLDVLAFIGDMDTSAEGENQLDHYYFPSLRGGDAMHLMHLATMAYHLTGDEQYRTFLYEELIGGINTVAVAHTTGAFDLPKFCKSWFGDQITYGPWWAFLELLDESPLKTQLMQAFHAELWDKLVKGAGNVDFNIMYAGALPPEIATDREQALAFALDNLPWMGGNGGALMGDSTDPAWLDDPRRTYTVTAEQVMAAVPDGVTAECITEAEVEICTAEIEFMGASLPNLGGFDRHTCPATESPYECEHDGGQCSTKQASAPLPLPLRPHTDFLWQRNPFRLGRTTPYEGWRQFAGSDLSEPYWNARRYGLLTEGASQVLAWESMGSCP